MKSKLFLLLLPFVLACGFVPLAPVYVVSETQTPTETVTATNTMQATSTSEAVFCVSAAESLNLRLSPSTSAEADSAGLQHGDRVERIWAVPGWMKVKTADGRQGWVRSSYVEVCE